MQNGECIGNEILQNAAKETILLGVCDIGTLQPSKE